MNLNKVGKRVATRLEGRSKGACHKCGASFADVQLLRASYCARCGTLYHTYDCGKRITAAQLTNYNPIDCPKASTHSFFCL